MQILLIVLLSYLIYLLPTVLTPSLILLLGFATALMVASESLNN